MNEESRAAFIVAQAAMLNCRVAGMVAENMQRAAIGASMAYVEDAFAALAQEFDGLLGYNAAFAFLRDGT